MSVAPDFGDLAAGWRMRPRTAPLGTEGMASCPAGMASSGDNLNQCSEYAPSWITRRPRGPTAGEWSVSGPDSGQLLEALEPAPVDAGLHRPEHRALQRRGRDDLLPASVGLGRLRRFILMGDSLPRALEQRSGGKAAEDAGEQAERTVQQLHRRQPSFR